MLHAQQTVVKKLLDASPEMQEHLTFFFTPEEASIVKNIPPFDPDLSSLTFSYDALLEWVHYSHLSPIIQQYDKKEAGFFLMALSEKTRKKLSSLIPSTLPAHAPSDIAKSFFRDILLTSLVGKEKQILPFSYLPMSLLNVLLKLSKDELCSLVDYLGLYDLAQSLKQTIDTKLIQKIQSYLPQQHVDFFKQIDDQKEPFPPKFSLQTWDKTQKSLHLMIHKAGLLKLAKALSPESPDLIWYVCHKFDTGRGAALLALSRQKENPTLAKFITKQILFVIQTKLH